jgi:hypothetical protein
LRLAAGSGGRWLDVSLGLSSLSAATDRNELHGVRGSHWANNRLLKLRYFRDWETDHLLWHPGQGCQIFLGQNWKNVPNDHKLYQKAINYTKWQ